MKKVMIFIALVSSWMVADAQIETPRPSPGSTVSQDLGLTNVSINYSRPGVKGRTIFGELVAYGKMWRTGANSSTKFKVADDVKVAGKELPAGEYSLYTIPGKDEWTVILSNDLNYSGNGKGYDQSKDQIRFTVKPTQSPVKVETMTFMFSNVETTTCDVVLAWENTQISFTVETEVDALVMAQIEKAMEGVSPMTYYRAAAYYLENDKDMNQALEWMNKAVADGGTFWMVHRKALILAKLGKKKEAIAAAEESKKLAQEAGNDDYVRMNDEKIKEWK